MGANESTPPVEPETPTVRVPKVNLPPFSTLEKPQLKFEGFNPFNHFVPGWSGDALTSKEVQKLGRIMEVLHADVKNQFQRKMVLPLKTKQSIFQEFLSFANEHDLITDQLCSTHEFFVHLFNPDSPYRIVLDQFSEKYSHRVAVVFFYKLRFIS